MLVDCTISVLFIMMWLWMWLSWLNRVSPLDRYIGSDVTFHYIYIWLNVTFQHTNSLGVSSMRGPLMIVTFLVTCHIDIEELYVASKMRTDLCKFVNTCLLCFNFSLCILLMGVAVWSYQYIVFVYWYCTCFFFVEYRASSGMLLTDLC